MIRTEKHSFDWYIFFSLTTVLIIHAIFTLLNSPIWSSDSHTYSRWADVLIEKRFNYSQFMKTVRHSTPFINRITWLYLISFIKMIAADYWDSVFILIQFCIYGIMVFFTLVTVKLLTKSKTIILFTGVLLLICLELFMWLPYVLTDILFAGTCFGLIISIFNNIELDKKNSFSLISLIIFSVIAFTLRPTIYPLFVGLILSFVFCLTKKRSVLLLLIIVLFTGSVIVLISHALFMKTPEKWPFSFGAEYISLISSYYKDGVVIDGRVSTYLTNKQGNNITDILVISLVKILSFFRFFISDFSIKHNLLNIAFFTPVYFFSIYAFITLFTIKPKKLGKLRSMIIINTCIIYSFCMFHSITLIDFDWRYRTPILILFIIQASIGGHLFLRRMRVNGEWPVQEHY